jgi:hypothetical protein
MVRPPQAGDRDGFSAAEHQLAGLFGGLFLGHDCFSNLEALRLTCLSDWIKGNFSTTVSH